MARVDPVLGVRAQVSLDDHGGEGTRKPGFEGSPPHGLEASLS
eukprot:CAMPEP_0168450254 /NCGR_PEP_ID=MMETSP0228-20121227/48019_1 /TAXON_ID=133427 /ORGANISM="Protoceratium reticulatum, Strain CCCM 535 (=CCMP 1889)" /LENGTH=42 /DNA_ID= /DNA_START= /DNA_END= /DNA_ORIENTATION=